MTYLFGWFFLLYSGLMSLWLIEWCTFGAYKAWVKYETELELTLLWKEHFETNVAAGWIFYDSLGA